MYTKEDVTKQVLAFNEDVEERGGLGIPTHMIDGLASYIAEGREPGGFLASIFKNDLCGAVSSADETNIGRLRSYVRFLQYHAPPACYSSERRYYMWLDHRGFLGKSDDPVDTDQE